MMNKYILSILILFSTGFGFSMQHSGIPFANQHRLRFRADLYQSFVCLMKSFLDIQAMVPFLKVDNKRTCFFSIEELTFLFDCTECKDDDSVAECIRSHMHIFSGSIVNWLALKMNILSDVRENYPRVRKFFISRPDYFDDCNIELTEKEQNYVAKGVQSGMFFLIHLQNEAILYVIMKGLYRGFDENKSNIYFAIKGDEGSMKCAFYSIDCLESTNGFIGSVITDPRNDFKTLCEECDISHQEIKEQIEKAVRRGSRILRVGKTAKALYFVIVEMPYRGGDTYTASAAASSSGH